MAAASRRRHVRYKPIIITFLTKEKAVDRFVLIEQATVAFGLPAAKIFFYFPVMKKNSIKFCIFALLELKSSM